MLLAWNQRLIWLSLQIRSKHALQVSNYLMRCQLIWNYLQDELIDFFFLLLFNLKQQIFQYVVVYKTSNKIITSEKLRDQNIAYISR